MDGTLGPRLSNAARSFNGCWTCRIRRKKCDESHPIYDACHTLRISCYYGEGKPDWMDGGSQQDAMSEGIKRQIKDNAHSRRGERAITVPDESVSGVETSGNEWIVLSQERDADVDYPMCHVSGDHRDCSNEGLEIPGTSPAREVDPILLHKTTRSPTTALDQTDLVLITFYLEHLLPFLFPFYQPSILEGGRAWILDMMIRSPVVRKATLCQSSYFFSLAQELSVCNVVWETVLAQTKEAFDVLRRALGVIAENGIEEHLHGAVRILASIMQVQRFDVAVSSFENCRAHLTAALAIFKQIMASAGGGDTAHLGTGFETVIARLGPSAWILPTDCIQVPSSEQAAFRFSSTLLVFDDIIASTVLQEEPSLYQYHHDLLLGSYGVDPLINTEAVVGCQNWVLLQIGEVAVIDAWKQQCKRDGSLDVMRLVLRATAIKDSLLYNLARLEDDSSATTIITGRCVLGVFSAKFGPQSSLIPNQNHITTQVWAHAALTYLHVVVSGWQPASTDIRYHVARVIELLTTRISPPELLRTMMWPFCVAGCLAEPAQEAQMRGLIDALQPPRVFGTARKTLGIMEHVWRNRGAGDASSRDLASCFRSQGDFVLLV